MYDQYTRILGSGAEAMRRVCIKTDAYWDKNIYSKMNNLGNSTSIASDYLKRVSVLATSAPNKPMSYDDTLSRDKITEMEERAEVDRITDISSNAIPDDDRVAPDELVDFWGSGLKPKMYFQLQKRFDDWSKQYEHMDFSDIAILKQICNLECMINEDMAAGRPIEKHTNALNTLLGSANLKPIQKREEASALESVDKTPFGVWIKRIEDTEPIPEASDEFKDVDGIAKYVRVWFFGHLCKMLNIKNSYSEEYEEEIKRLSVERPQLEEDEISGDVSG